jgi:hypothetical protein
LEESNAELQASIGLQLAAGPRTAIRTMAVAKQRGQAREVLEALANREQELRLQIQRKSLPQVASGLRAWHEFATNVLDYDPQATIPPSSAEDVSKFLCCFTNGGTAGNYLSYLKWTCREFRKSLAWVDSTLASLVRSLHKQDIATRISQLPETLRLAEETIERLVLLAWELQDPEWGIMAALSFSFLFRVQSECLPLECGSRAEAVNGLPQGRHSSIYVDEGKLVVRLRCRKNRPQGSILVRECSCANGRDQRLCVVHCMSWSDQIPGDRLFTLTPSQTKQKLRRYSRMLGVRESGTLILKTFRASRATALALQGRPMHQILEAGEWRSAAFLRYVTSDSLDAGAVLSSSVMAETDSDSD